MYPLRSLGRAFDFGVNFKRAVISDKPSKDGAL